MTEVARRPSAVDDYCNQALETALEMSMLNINSKSPTSADLSFSGRYDFQDFQEPKSQNITECVAVPSSEHVAEIVGRQGMRLQWDPLNGSEQWGN